MFAFAIGRTHISSILYLAFGRATLGLLLFSPIIAGSVTMTVPPVVDAQWLNQNRANVKIVAVSSGLPEKPNWKEFRDQNYGKFDELMKNQAIPKELIPGSVFFNFSVAYFPGEFERFSLYSPEIFQDYIRKLGIDFYDHVVVYSSGPALGMLFAARAWWTFKLYGHENVSVLTGGLDAWKSAGLPIVSEIAPVKVGNWTAKPVDHTLLATFEELEARDQHGKSSFDRLDNINYFDARSKEQFTGEQPLGFPAPDAKGSHLSGAKNLPLSVIMTEKGLKSKDEIQEAMEKAGFHQNQPIVTACNGGIQASLLSLGLSVAGYKSKVYNGSMTEIAARASHLINEK